jgi:hypothetical protein
MEKLMVLVVTEGRHKRYATEPQGKKGTQEEIAELLGVSQQWVSKYDLKSLESCETFRYAKFCGTAW